MMQMWKEYKDIKRLVGMVPEGPWTMTVVGPKLQDYGTKGLIRLHEKGVELCPLSAIVPGAKLWNADYLAVEALGVCPNAAKIVMLAADDFSPPAWVDLRYYIKPLPIWSNPIRRMMVWWARRLLVKKLFKGEK